MRAGLYLLQSASNVRFWHTADKHVALKVRRERDIVIRNLSIKDAGL
jgi:hypothetical protein